MGSNRFKVLVCRGPTCGTQHGSSVLMDRLKRDLAEAGLEAEAELGWQSCFGRCSQGPNMLVRDRGEGAAAPPSRSYSVAIMPERRRGRAALYSRLTEADMSEVVAEHIGNGRVVRRLLSVRPKRTANPDEPARPGGHRLPQVLSTVRGIPPDGEGA